jgi:transglutaminase-like putative cysteine protease
MPVDWRVEGRMRLVPRWLVLLALLAPLGLRGQETRTYRQWIAGQEVGGASETLSGGPAGQLFESHEWSHLQRMGADLVQDLRQTARKGPDGSLSFGWTLSLSAEPMEGQGSWSPKEPGKLRLALKNGGSQVLDLPAGALLWPGDQEAGLKAAARARKPLRQKSFSFPTQQWTELDLQPVGPDPLPGFPDTVRFQGRSNEGGMVEELEVWLSPSAGEVKHQGSMAGIPLLYQRAELPAPAQAGPAGSGLFERTIKALPPNPFLLWLPSLTVRWTGKGDPKLPEDPQQRRLGPGRLRLAQALPPGPREATEPPVAGTPSPADAPYLAATPLAQFKDPVFDGLLRRLAAPPQAGRWELAKRVTAFVYEWIRDKNYTVGFASAQEVARHPEGACAQHGVLAVALLRRLGVPARGVTGWMAFGETLGLHFWVEVEVGGRWIPVDPTFGQAPASAYRLKLGTTDLADLGSLGWGAAQTDVLEGVWAPEEPWASAVRVQGDAVLPPGGGALRLPGARWNYAAGQLELLWEGRHRVEAVPCPAPAQMEGARRLQGAASRRGGWWHPAANRLWIDLEGGRWLQVDGLDEGQAFRLLDALRLDSAPAAAQAA